MRCSGTIEAAAIGLSKSKKRGNFSYEQALIDLNQALRIDGGNAVSYSNRG